MRWSKRRDSDVGGRRGRGGSAVALATAAAVIALIASNSPAAMAAFFTIQLPPQATTCGSAR